MNQDWKTVYSCNFENGSLSNPIWENNPSYPWVITNVNPKEGGFCMKSGNSGIYSTSTISIALDIPHAIMLSFWAKISSQSCPGCFYIDEEVKINGITGNGDWVHYSYEVAPGPHTFTWSYNHSDYYNYFQYDDCFYVDNIIFGDVQINALNTINDVAVPSGSYYLVASSTSDEFSVFIDSEAVPVPVAASSPFPCNNYNAYNENPDSLFWTLGEFTMEYQVLFGETDPPTNVLIDWTDQLGKACAIEVIDAKTYYWKVNERNTSGTTAGELWSFTTYKGINISAENIIYLTPTGAGIKDGSSWENAASNIQVAIDSAIATPENIATIWLPKESIMSGMEYANILMMLSIVLMLIMV